MTQSIAMIRFLMFSILVLIIFFNLIPRAVTYDNVQSVNSSANSGSTNIANSEDKYCLVDGKLRDEDDYLIKKCVEKTNDKSCQNEFDTKTECEEWKSSMNYDYSVYEDENGKQQRTYEYDTGDVDKQTSINSNKMIYCLDTNSTCTKTAYSSCNGTSYISKNDCDAAKDSQKGSDIASYDFKSCLVGDNCEWIVDGTQCDGSNYCNMNKCKDANSKTSDKGEYCFINGACKELECEDNSCVGGKFYKSFEKCEAQI